MNRQGLEKLSEVRDALWKLQKVIEDPRVLRGGGGHWSRNPLGYLYTNVAGDVLAIGAIDSSLIDPSDLDITCGANNTIELQNTVYEDLQFTIHTGRVPAVNFPTWEAFTANTSAYAFSVGDYIDCESNEIPHFWKEATAGHLHVHFSNKTIQNTGANRFAQFTIWLTMADAGEVFAELPYTAEYTIPTATAALTHLYLDMGNIDLSTYLIGAQIVPRVKRIAATGGTEYADDVYIHQVGIHLEKDTMGSRNELTK